MLATAENDYNVSLLFDLTKLPEDWKSLAVKASRVKRNCFASVFEQYFAFQEKGETGHKTAVINYREDETMFVRALPDRVTVIFSTVFSGEDDVIFGKVMLQGFADTSKAKFHQAPQILYSHKKPPAELNDTDAAVGDDRGYITFGKATDYNRLQTKAAGLVNRLFQFCCRVTSTNRTATRRSI